MPEAELTLSPPRQMRVAGVSVGILWVAEDAGAPVAMLGVYNPETRQPETNRVRQGDQLTVAGRRFQVLEITPTTGAPGKVRLTVSWPDPA